MESGVLSIEFFSVKPPPAEPAAPDMFMAVPYQCGLHEADTLRLKGQLLEPMLKKSIMPLDLPLLEPEVCEKLTALAQADLPLPVGEFFARGLVNAYLIPVVVSG